MDYIIHNTVLRLSPGTPQGSGRIYCVRITLCIVYVLYCVRIYTPQGTGRI